MRLPDDARFYLLTGDGREYPIEVVETSHSRRHDDPLHFKPWANGGSRDVVVTGFRLDVDGVSIFTDLYRQRVPPGGTYEVTIDSLPRIEVIR